MTGLEELTGRTLGDFVVRHRIGEGGFGAVYRAEQPLLGREAVIKVLHTRHRASKTAIQRFLREARLASKLDHPYAAHIYAFGVEPDGLIWIAMEYVRGQTLHEVLREKGAMSLEELVPLLDRICEVLQAAHELGIVHRDIKPPNVMVVSRSGRTFPKLLDFGIAKLNVDDAPAAASEAAAPSVSIPPLSPSPSPSLSASVARDVTPIAPSVVEPAKSEHTVSFVGKPGGALAALNGRPQRPTNRGALAETMQVASPSFDEPALTEAGAAMGSPPYMAPEQWSDSSAATARTDLYALGILTFEALTGRRPFTGSTMIALAVEHASAPVPSLGSAFPGSLDTVMAKVLAKDPANRYASALTFAAELRAAAGFGTQPLPVLDDDLRLSVETSFPQPIAEAVAAFHAARNAHHGRDALREIVTTAIRYASLIALAAYSQVRPDGAPVASLRDLRKRTLTDEEWLSLAREVTRPFAAKPGVHPVPELVALLAEAGDDWLGALATTQRSDPDALAVIHVMLHDVTRLLRALTFLADYQLVVRDGGRAESWMGLRRQQRIAVELLGRTVEPGQPVLLDATSRPVLSLWPLVQTSSPLLGSPPELFLLDGRGRRGARLLALPHALERNDEQLWEWLGSRFAARDDKSITPDTGETAPYRGLAAFTAHDADSFVGRERETEGAVNRLRVSPLLAVVGPSGAGKSSFVHAGIVPALPADWTVVTIRPGTAPLAALDRGLKRLGLAALGGDADALGDLLDARPGTTVIVVDQLEELFTLGTPLDEQRAFVRALLAAARSADDRVRIVFTLRDDFLARATQLPELRERLPAALFLLGTPEASELVRILKEPLARVGFELEDPALADRMVREVADTPGALPLLAFTANKLWELRDRQFRQLTRRAYESLGGVAGALAQHAEATLSSMSAHEQRCARVALGHLVTAEGTRAVLTRAELHQLVDDPAAEAVLEKLIAARLLVATDAEGGDDAIELVHEALLVAWPRLATWRREDAEGARMRDQLRTAARHWETRNRQRGLLWRDDVLAEYRIWRARHPGAVTDVEEAFAGASVADATRGRRIRNGLVIGAFAVLAIGLTVTLQLRQRAADQASLVRAQLVKSYEERGRQALLAGNAEVALVYLNEAFQMGDDRPAMRFLLARAMEPFQSEIVTLRGHKGQVWQAQFSPDGTKLLTAAQDSAARLWDPATGAELHRLDGHALSDFEQDVQLAWSSDGKRIATGDGAGALRTWTSDGGLIAKLPGTGVGITAIAFSPNGTLVAAATYDGHVMVWDGTSTTGRSWASGDGSIQSITFDPLGQHVLTASKIGTPVLWSVDGHRELELKGHTQMIWSAVFDRTGDRIATASFDTTARIWDAHTGETLHVLRGHEAAVTNISFDPSGTLVATASADETARLWDAATGEPRATLRGHVAQVNKVVFLADGRLVTVGADGTARVWDPSRGLQIASVRHGGYLWGVSVNGNRLATASWSGTAKVWDLTRQTHLRTFADRAADHHHFTVMSSVVGKDQVVMFGDTTVARWSIREGTLHTADIGATIQGGGITPDGGDVVIVDERGNLHVFGASGSLAPPIAAHVGAKPVDPAQPQGGAICAAISADGRRGATCGADGVIAIWDLATRQRVASRATRRMFNQARFSPAGDQLLVTSQSTSDAILLSADLERVAELKGHRKGIDQAEFALDGQHFASAGWEGIAFVWNRDGSQLLQLPHGGSPLMALAWSPDGSAITTAAADGALSRWRIADGTRTGPVTAHYNFIASVASSPDGDLVATAGADRTVKVWDAKLMLELTSIRTGNDFADYLQFDASGRLITADQTHADLWDMSRYTGDAAALAKFLRCRVSLELVDDRLVVRTTEVCGR